MGRRHVAEKNIPVSFSLPASLNKQFEEHVEALNQAGISASKSGIVARLIREEIANSQPIEMPVKPQVKAAPVPPSPSARLAQTSPIQTHNNGLPEGLLSEEDWAAAKAAVEEPQVHQEPAPSLSSFLRKHIRQTSMDEKLGNLDEVGLKLAEAHEEIDRDR